MSIIFVLYHRGSVYCVKVASASLFPVLYGIICLWGHAILKPSALVRDTLIVQGQKMERLMQVMPWVKVWFPLPINIQPAETVT